MSLPQRRGSRARPRPGPLGRALTPSRNRGVPSRRYHDPGGRPVWPAGPPSSVRGLTGGSGRDLVPALHLGRTVQLISIRSVLFRSTDLGRAERELRAPMPSCCGWIANDSEGPSTLLLSFHRGPGGILAGDRLSLRRWSRRPCLVQDISSIPRSGKGKTLMARTNLNAHRRGPGTRSSVASASSP